MGVGDEVIKQMQKPHQIFLSFNTKGIKFKRIYHSRLKLKNPLIGSKTELSKII